MIRLFGKSKKRKKWEDASETVGIFLFDVVTDAIKAESVLEQAGYEIALVAPPHHLRAGCDLAVALPVMDRLGAERVLAEKGVVVRDWADSLDGTVDLADIVTTEDFGEWLMVRAGNMKITVEKATRRIVNTSGGGCPDIPYLNLEFVGHTLDEDRRPRDLGYTLCGLMLDRAFLEARHHLSEGVVPDEGGAA